MEIGKITVSGYEVLKVEDLTMTAALNDHSRMRLRCMIDSGHAREYLECAADGRPVTVREGDTILFCGITTQVTCSAEKEFMRMELCAESYSSLWDREKKTRSFQDTGMQVMELAETVLREEGQILCLFHGENLPLGKLTVQYQETVWEFLKRIASKYHTCIYTRMNQNSRHLIWGLDPGENIQDIHVTGAAVEQDISGCRRKKNRGITDVLEQDALIYELYSDTFLLPGDAVSFDGLRLYICEASYSMSRADLVAQYRAKTEHGLKVSEIFCCGMAGAALEGTIIAVAGEKIKAHLAVDKKQDPGKAYWFPFSAMTAATDGSGWYYMPEIGDCVKVCLPSLDESNAFAVSAVSSYEAPGGEENRMKDPNVKYMHNPSGKDLALTPNGIRADSNGGMAAMKLNTDGSIMISSQDILHVAASGNIEIAAEQDIEIQADIMIDVKSDQSGELLLDEQGEVKGLGGRVNVNMET